MFIARAHLELLEERLSEARIEIARLTQELHDERERNRKREEDLVDRVLTRHGSRPISPSAEPPPVPQQVYSSLAAARLDDRRQEYLEVHGLEGQHLTPHIQQQLDEYLEQETKRDLSYVNSWQR